MATTFEYSEQYESTGNEFVDFQSKAGSMFKNSNSFYEEDLDINQRLIELFTNCWNNNKELSFKLLLWLRDCRGGAGNRSGGRILLQWVANNDPAWVKLNLNQIKDVGRWDDIEILFNTGLRLEASQYWANAINEKNVLAAKWADRKMVPIRKALNIKKESEFRKLLASIRSSMIVETKMSNKEYNTIEYTTVPSVAMARYSNAFYNNDNTRFNQFKKDVAENKVKINTSVLFPHDCVRTALGGDQEVANLQFDNLPDYIDNKQERIMVLCDTSASMHCKVAGSIQAVHISMGLALYCSNKIGKENPFYRKFIGFESESKFISWENMTFSQALTNNTIFDEAVGSTNIDKALELILMTARMYNLTNDQIPTALLIISDMQFSIATDPEYTWKSMDDKRKKPPVKIQIENWIESGYNPPKIIYWNTAGYAGSPDLNKTENTALVSGFSSTILKSIFNGDDISPMSVLLRSLEKYKINIPE